MTTHLDSITEDEMSDVLASMRWMRDCCRIMDRLGAIAAEVKPRPGLNLPSHEQNLLPWWFSEWGDRATVRLTWGTFWWLKTRYQTPSLAADSDECGHGADARKLGCAADLTGVG